MSALPEQYQQYAAHVGQRPVYPAAVELRGERQAVAWVPSAENPSVMVAVPKEFVQPMQPAAPRDLTPQPLFDPLAQRMIGGGVGGGVLLWGGGKFLVGLGDALSALSGTGLLLLFLALAGVRAFGGGRRGSTHIEVHQHARFGKNQVTM